MPRVHVTFLAAHVVPPEYFGRRPDYIDAVSAWCADAATVGADSVDVNCEDGRFTEEEARWILSAGRRKSMLSVPGIAGYQARTIRQFEYETPPGAAVILHSDGLSSRWSPDNLPGVTGRDPLVAAAALLAEAGTHRDDASVLVLKP